jgi:hypothetical protein
MSANTPESKPQPNDNPAIWTLVRDAAREAILDPKDAVLGGLLEDMLARDEMGRAKYGTPLQAHNGRNPWTDAYQEALDGTAYAKQMQEEAATNYEREEAGTVFDAFVRLAYRLKRAAIIRQGWTP